MRFSYQDQNFDDIRSFMISDMRGFTRDHFSLTSKHETKMSVSVNGNSISWTDDHSFLNNGHTLKTNMPIEGSSEKSSMLLIVDSPLTFARLSSAQSQPRQNLSFVQMSTALHLKLHRILVLKPFLTTANVGPKSSKLESGGKPSGWFPPQQLEEFPLLATDIRFVSGRYSTLSLVFKPVPDHGIRTTNFAAKKNGIWFPVAEQIVNVEENNFATKTKQRASACFHNRHILHREIQSRFQFRSWSYSMSLFWRFLSEVACSAQLFSDNGPALRVYPAENYYRELAESHLEPHVHLKFHRIPTFKKLLT